MGRGYSTGMGLLLGICPAWAVARSGLMVMAMVMLVVGGEEGEGRMGEGGKGQGQGEGVSTLSPLLC